jgi:hypothetical protein
MCAILLCLKNLLRDFQFRLERIDLIERRMRISPTLLDITGLYLFITKFITELKPGCVKDQLRICIGV